MRTLQMSCTSYNYCTLYNKLMSTPERPSRRGAGQRAGLSRELVLAAARRIADEEGVDRLTMRRLAAELGVLPNALYTYVPDKEALLDALLDALLGDVDAGDPAEGDWCGGGEGVEGGWRVARGAVRWAVFCTADSSFVLWYLDVGQRCGSIML